MSPSAAVSGPVMTLASSRSCSEATALVLRRSQSVNKSSHWGIALLCLQQSKPGRSLAITRQTRQRHFNITKAMASEEYAAVTEQDGGADASSQPNLVIVGAGTLGTLAAQCWKQASAFRMDLTRFHHRLPSSCHTTLSTHSCSRVHHYLSPIVGLKGPLGASPLVICRGTPRPWCTASPARPSVTLSFGRSA